MIQCEMKGGERKGKEFCQIRAASLWNLENVKPLATLEERGAPLLLFRSMARIIFAEKVEIDPFIQMY